MLQAGAATNGTTNQATCCRWQQEIWSVVPKNGGGTRSWVNCWSR